MKTQLSLTVLLTLMTIQSILAQAVFSTDSLLLNEGIENIQVQELFSDSLSSTFAIAVKHEVKPHYHQYHSETIIVIQGSGSMSIGDKTIAIKKGDILNIPKNTVHDLVVTSEEMVKVISIQAPEFKGKDRIFIGQ